ncbi:hypothetical protein [Candidatus Magnetaquicoccus inordinatus]|uniref:hypothetical protein n=1 Tax=Candidatus Magnetaquicoccus inordinatus TaxID=2496818 RepID=UPI00102B93F4|nr:hypothetical protein [Candidatus Magnetaquicoccus inordinatus]
MSVRLRCCHIGFMLLLCLPSSLLAGAAAVIPPELDRQIVKLADLLRDAVAEENREGRIVQTIRNVPGGELVLVVLSVGGFAGGNMHTQYLAVFSWDEDAQAARYYTLVDVIAIGGRGWRSISAISPQGSYNMKSGAVCLHFEAMINQQEDAPNFPSSKGKVQFLLQAARLQEIQEKNSPCTSKMQR